MSSLDTVMTELTVSAVTWLIWDWCLTFDDEVRFVWSKSYKVPIKWAFLSARYVGILSLCSGHILNLIPISCQAKLGLLLALDQILVTTVEIIMVLRVHALYNRNHRMGIFLGFLAISGTIAEILGWALSMPVAQFDPQCVVIHIGPSSPSFLIIFLAIDGLFLLLTLLKCIHAIKTSGNWVPVISVMLRDGTLAFFAITALMLPNIILLITAHGAFAQILTPHFTAMMSCLGCRLILNMQRLPLNLERQHSTTESLPMLTSNIAITIESRSTEAT
ncbi:hypothetical protein BJ138DRAFT_691561 [Hygrophoropsis aurantiaca]|uniref:Uncharacterized protein n=1 Tax=Hygrophoropsis aurantiaca TaxID=72124 RepID=A0ACB8AT31_9AGAM|nr:hypothetical protein BJ138DRAFT_691561 [Hygrophoropsis aurantiaca]